MQVEVVANLAYQRQQLLIGLPETDRRRVQPLGHHDFEGCHTNALPRIHRDDGYAQLLLQRRQIDVYAVALGHVHHIKGQHGRQPQIAELCKQQQATAQVVGIHRHDHKIGVVISRLVVEQICNHLLVQALGIERVRARQVDNLGPLGGRELGHAGFAVHGHAGEVAHLLVEAGELVKKRSFAAVRIADEGNAQGPGIGLGTGLRRCCC